LTFSFKSAIDIIDSIIKLENRNNGREDGWYGILTGLIRAFSAFNDTEPLLVVFIWVPMKMSGIFTAVTQRLLFIFPLGL
ncbi:hypothetical protein DL111_24320, partial [Salmonella enterica subsp. enterica]|nr:hypothetical protein [Salmonella enterica subsp. enterica serovar Sandiego]